MNRIQDSPSRAFPDGDPKVNWHYVNNEEKTECKSSGSYRGLIYHIQSLGIGKARDFTVLYPGVWRAGTEGV